MATKWNLLDDGPVDSERNLLKQEMAVAGSPDEVPNGTQKRHFWWFIEKKDSDDADDWYF